MQFARRLFIAALAMVSVLVGVRAAQAQATKILPADTEMVVTLNLKQILGSEVAKSNKALIEIAKVKIAEQLEEKGLGKWLKEADFDLFRDLASVTVGFPAGRSWQEGFIVLEGKFDADKIENAVLGLNKDSGDTVKVIKIAKVKAFEVAPKNEKALYVGILNEKTMIACATRADFADAVARLNSTKESAFRSATFKGLLETVNKKQSISLAATSKFMNQVAENNPNAGNKEFQVLLAVLQKLDGASIAITIQRNIDFQARVNAKDADTSQSLGVMANGGLILLKAKAADQAKQNEKWTPLVEVANSLRANATGPNLVITGQITFETLSKLLKNLPGN